MLFDNKNAVTEFYPTFLKEDRSFLRKIYEMLSNAESHVYIVCPWITLGEELVVPLENALTNNLNFELYLITKLLKEDVYNRIQQLEDIEKWMDILKGQMHVKYNNNVHSKMIIVDGNEVIVGSSNLTGSGLGSSRDYEGVPQIESNIYTTNKQAVQEATDFFSKIWYHKGSKDYDNEKYVLSCKSHNLSGIFQKYKNDFWKIAKQEGIYVENDKISFKGIIAYLDKNKAYITGKNRKDIAISISNDGYIFKNRKIGDEIFIRGNIHADDLDEFQVTLDSSFKRKIEEQSTPSKKSKLSNLKPGLRYISLNAVVANINKPFKLETKYGEKYLTLIELQDESGRIVFELWGDTPNNPLKVGKKIEIINAYTKDYDGNIRLALHKNGEINHRS